LGQDGGLERCATPLEKRLSRLSKQIRKVAVDRRNVIAPYDLPPAHRARWTPLRKVELIAAILAGAITLDEARARYADDRTALRMAAPLAARGLSGLEAAKRIGRRKEVAPRLGRTVQRDSESEPSRRLEAATFRFPVAFVAGAFHRRLYSSRD
jgi:hypothetical protein